MQSLNTGLDLDSLYDDIMQEEGSGEPTSTQHTVDTDDPNEFIQPDNDFTTLPDVNFLGTPKEDSDRSNSIQELGQSGILEDLLRLKGIDDIDKISYEDEDGSLISKSFYDLDYEEQIALLNTTTEEQTVAPHEYETLNWLRQNNISFEEAIEYFKNEAVNNYIESQQASSLEGVSSYSDEELFILDLSSRYSALTEEQLFQQLQLEQQNPEVFKTKMEGMRKEYIELEAQEKAQEIELLNQQKEQQENEKIQNVINAAVEHSEIGGITLDDTDKNEVLNFLFTKDVNSRTALDKFKADPKNEFELAWYALKGREAFNFIHDYYKKEIDKISKASYEKGKSESLGKQTQSKKGGVVRQPLRKQTPSVFGGDSPISIDDLYNT